MSWQAPRRTSAPPDGDESAEAGAARASRADVLAVEASEASSSGSEDDEGGGGDGDVAAGMALLAAGAAAMNKNDQSNQHESGVWGRKLPTGFVLTSERCAKMDHKNGKPWEVEVWNMIGNPKGGNDVVNALPFPRFYEHKPRSLLMVLLFLGKLKEGDLQGLEPHERIYPTGFS